MLPAAIEVIMVIIDAREAGATEMRMRPKAIRTAASALVFSQIGLRPKLSSAQNVESILNDCRTVDNYSAIVQTRSGQLALGEGLFPMLCPR